MRIMTTIDQKKKPLNILVVGDIILDQYIWTSVSRISPEAPVPVCHVNNISTALGGAANVANNLVALGVNVAIAGVIGDDSYGHQIQTLLDQSGINNKYTVVSKTISTICKSRIIAKNQQVCRLDYEEPSIDISKQSKQLINQLQQKLPNYDLIVLSDYNKGVVSDELSQAIISNAKQLNQPVVVDPKGFFPKKYNGATLITPNLSEFNSMTNPNAGTDRDIFNEAKRLLSENNIESILLTMSEKGIRYITQENTIDFPTTAKDVVDVTGAGDTVIAAIAYGLGLGLNANDMIKFANLAAGVVVSKVGTATATLDNIQDYESHL